MLHCEWTVQHEFSRCVLRTALLGHLCCLEICRVQSNNITLSNREPFNCEHPVANIIRTRLAALASKSSVVKIKRLQIGATLGSEEVQVQTPCHQSLQDPYAENNIRLFTYPDCQLTCPTLQIVASKEADFFEVLPQVSSSLPHANPCMRESTTAQPLFASILIWFRSPIRLSMNSKEDKLMACNKPLGDTY
jgi:hypothetical protein